MTEEEIRVLISQGAEAGVFEEAESDMVESVFRLGERRVSAMMVPRTDVNALFTDDSIEEIRHKLAESGHSSYPVCEGSLDHVLGVVYAKDLLKPVYVRPAAGHQGVDERADVHTGKHACAESARAV